MKMTVIHAGTLVDPAQGLCGEANLICSGGKVSEIHLSPSAEEVEYYRNKADLFIDAEGKTVSPGFVDIHMHEDPYDAENDVIHPNITSSMALMGVTTAVGGNCGSNEGEPDRYLDAIDRDGAPVNLALMAGHTFLREHCGGVDKYAPVSSCAVAAMGRMAKKYLDAGCVGISFGVKYVPGTTWEEIIALSRLCREGDKLVPSHVRMDVDGVFNACEELAEIGRQAGVKVQFSHIGSMGGYGQMERLLDQIEKYRAEGIDMMCDCYPYDAFSTQIGATTYDPENFAAYRSDYDRILLCDGPYAGKRCNRELFEKMRRERPETMTVGYFMQQNDVDLALMSPLVMLGSDGIRVGDQGHPRAAGAFPRFLRQYAATNRISLSEAIAKVTAMPAERLALKEKGNLKIGSDADIVIFDLEKIEDRATYTQPVLSPIGIEWVLIGGETVVRNGELVRDDLGRAVRR